jgi:RNA polymerase sigma-70 factor (ECF subfamily)
MSVRAKETAANDEGLMATYQRTGNHAVFRELFKRLGPLVLRLMRTSGLTDEDARDLVQQTFLQLHLARADYRPGAPLRPWLLTIAYNLKRDLIRKRGRRPEAPLDRAELRDAPGQHAGLAQKREARRLREALLRLPDDQRTVIVLHWFAEIPYGEVAQILGISQGAAKVRAHRGYRRLRGLLEGET